MKHTMQIIRQHTVLEVTHSESKSLDHLINNMNVHGYIYTVNGIIRIELKGSLENFSGSTQVHHNYRKSKQCLLENAS